MSTPQARPLLRPFSERGAALDPDIDLDFPREIRERLIERVYEVRARARRAGLRLFDLLRSAVRDVGKALGLPLPELDKIAKLSEPRSAKELGNELARVPGYAQRKDALPWCYLIELADQLSGFPRTSPSMSAA